MNLYSLPIDAISYQEVETFLNARFPESEILDYKSDWKDDLQNVMAAFANGMGGLVLIGVEEERGTGRPDLPPTGVDITDGEDKIRLRVESKAFDAIYPPIFPEVGIIPFANDPTRGVVLVRIAESADTPHATANRRRIYVRVRSQNRFIEQDAGLDELERLWARRASSVAVRARLLSEAEERYRIMQLAYPLRRPPETPSVVNAYVLPYFPDYRRIDLKELLDFARTAVANSRARYIFDRFPVGTPIVRPIADGIGLLPYSDGSDFHWVQLNQWGLIHSQLWVPPHEGQRPNPLFFPHWFVAHVDAFLRYACAFCEHFSTFRVKPLQIAASVTFPEISHMLWPRQIVSNEPNPILESNVMLLDTVIAAHQLADSRRALLRGAVQRICWAGGMAFAADEQKIDDVMQQLSLTDSLP